MSTWFELDLSFGKVKAVEVASSTERTITLAKPGYGTGRRDKSGRYTCYFPTFEEAKDYAIKKAESECTALRLRLQRANGDLGRIKGMKNPQEPTP